MNFIHFCLSLNMALAYTLSDPNSIAANMPCSKESSTSITLMIENQRTTPVDIYWKDYQCKLVQYETLRSNMSYAQQTYISHPWVAVDFTTGRVISALAVTAARWVITDVIAGGNTTDSSNPTSTIKNGDSSSQNGNIVMIIIIAIVILGLGILGIYLYRKRQTKSPKNDGEQSKLVMVDRNIDSFNTITMNPSEVTTQNSIQPPIQGHSMIGESVLFDSRLVIRKKMAGSGGCGQVYLALYSNQLAVAKIPIMEKHEDLVYQESNIMNALVSPWTVQVLHYISNSPMPIGGLDYTPRSALIVEYMNLGPLSTYLDKSGNESEEKITLVLSQTLSIATMAARGIEFMHSRGFNHLDIKPENILLHQQADNTVIAKLSDFGSTRPEGSYDAIFQTPGFIPPEGIVQHNQLILPQKTSKYDIYAFGGCLINMIFLANYAAMWSGTKKTIEQKKSFLSSSIGNSDLLQLIVDCLQDSPSLRPAANNIVDRLLHFKQSDFSIKSDNQTRSTLQRPDSSTFSGDKRSSTVASTLTDNKRSSVVASTLYNTSHSGIYRQTPGKYLLQDLELTNPAKWTDFLSAFIKSFEVSERFNHEQFKALVNPSANRVSSSTLDNGIFSSIEPLLLGSDENMALLWVDDFHDELARLIKKCTVSNE